MDTDTLLGIYLALKIAAPMIGIGALISIALVEYFRHRK